LNVADVSAGCRRVIYFGTPTVAAEPLEALCAAGHQVVLVVTRPPKRRGRRQAPTPSPVHEAAAELGLEVSHDIQDALGVTADVAVVVAYGEMIPEVVLQQRRSVNLHFSLLPRWRGAAPVERAILAGDTETGVCLMEVAPELDSGAIYRQCFTAIGPTETAEDLRARLCDLGIEMLLEALRDGFGDPEPQSGQVTWANKISSVEMCIDWNASAEHVMRLVRVGGAWTTFRGRRLNVLAAQLARAGNAEAGSDGSGEDSMELTESVARAGSVTLVKQQGRRFEVLVETGCGILRLLRVQSEGRSATSAQDWANGARLVVGDCFT